MQPFTTMMDLTVPSCYLSYYTTSSHCLFSNVHSFHYRLSVSKVVEYLSVCRNFCTELQGGGKEAATADPGFREGEGPLWEGCC